MPPLPSRPAAAIRRDGNRLRNESSLYLRQHAHNPVDWHPWGPEALAAAVDGNRPIFLSIGYSSCHWCHVMEKEAFDDDGIADFLNRHFICIKVDREERPDLDAVYMDAVQALTGQGGWPMSSFLTAEGRPFHGGTYFPPAHFRHLIEQVAHLWREKPGELREQADRIAAHIATTPDWSRQGGERLEGRWLDEAAARAAGIYDREHGGFNQRQKFPTPVKWRFLVRHWRHTRDESLRAMIDGTLAAIAGGGLRDHLGGGFFRYTVDAAWTVPHFEKMLYDNAQLASLFLEAGQALGNAAYTGIAHDTLEFLQREMCDANGGLYASFDADSGGEEGSYYVWSPDEIAAVVGPDEAGTLCALLGVGPEGNFEHSGRSVLTRRSGAGTGSTADTAGGDASFARHRAALLEARARRTPPGLDRKIVTAWNGLAIAALARGSVQCREAGFAATATAAAEFLLKNHRRADGSLWRASSDGRTAGEGILDDYAGLADGLFELFLATGEARWLAAARELAAAARDRFVHPDGGWYLTPSGSEAPLGRSIELFDNVEPSGNAVLLQLLLRLSAVTGDESGADNAEAVLIARAGLLERAGLDVAGWLSAAALALRPPCVVVVAGDGAYGADERTVALLAAARSTGAAEAMVVRVPAAGAGADLLAAAPALAGKVAVSGLPTAYVCRGRTCSAPCRDADALRAQLEG